MTRVSARGWLICTQPKPKPQLRLLCFPFAGGGAGIYRTWAQALPETVEVEAVQLPGRERRIDEPPYQSLRQLIAAFADAVLPGLDGPVALFGHSMGAMIAYAFAHELRRRGAPQPVHLLVSGRRAPHLVEPEPWHRLPDAQFLARLRQLGGVPEVLWQEPELMARFLPVLRADFMVNEAEAYVPTPPLACPITAYGGLSDDGVAPATLDAWRDHTEGAFARELLPGDHFFVQNAREPLLTSLARRLQATCRPDVQTAEAP